MNKSPLSVRAAAEGVPFWMIADMDDVTVEEINAICRRAVSKIRHPAYSPSSFTEDELEAERVLTACSDLIYGLRHLVGIFDFRLGRSKKVAPDIAMADDATQTRRRMGLQSATQSSGHGASQSYVEASGP